MKEIDTEKIKGKKEIEKEVKGKKDRKKWTLI